MGHALNAVLTESSNLPYILKRGNLLIKPTAESVAQFYQDVLLDDLERHPEVQRKLDIEHIFSEIAKEARALKLISEYKKNLDLYAILVLADKSFGNPRDPETLKRKREVLDKLSIDPSYATSVVEKNKNEFVHY